MELCQQKLCVPANGEWWAYVRKEPERCFLFLDEWVWNKSLKLSKCNSFREKVCLKQGWVLYHSKAGISHTQPNATHVFKPWPHVRMCGRCVNWFNITSVVVFSSHSHSHFLRADQGRMAGSAATTGILTGRYVQLSPQLTISQCYSIWVLWMWVLSVYEWSKLCWLAQAPGKAYVGTLAVTAHCRHAGRREHHRWGMGQSEGLSQLCHF